MPMLVPQTMAGQGSIGAGGMFTGISNLGSFPVSMLQPAAAPIAANSAAGMYPAVQGMYYMPAAPNAGSILPGQVSGMGGTGGRGMQHGNAMYANSVGMGADIMNAAAMGGLGGAYSTPMMRQPQSHGIMQSGTLQTMQAQYGLMQGGMQGQAGDGSGSMGMGMQGGLQSVDPYGSLPASLTRAMQSMRLGGNGQGRK